MKIPEIYLKGKKDPGLVDFMDYTMVILNQGLYQLRLVSAVPGWVANEGESVIYSSGTDKRLYIFIDGAWVSINWSGGYTSSDFWLWNPANQYLECYVNGTLRMQV